MFNFEIRKTLIFRSFKISSFPLFKHSSILSQLFFYLFIISLFLTGFYFLGFVSLVLAIKVPTFLLVCFIAFLEIHWFVELKIKKPPTNIKISEALLNPEDYNMAELLSLKSSEIAEESIKMCRERKLYQVISEALFYALLKKSKDMRILIYRLGLDVKKMEGDLKNYLEKQQRQDKFNLSFSNSFQKTITAAGEISEKRGHGRIEEKDILVALSKHDEFFKKNLIEYELKEQDVENITLWSDFIEKRVKQNKAFWTKENLLKLGSLGRDFASGFTVTLDQFSIDWAKIIQRSLFNEVIGHKEEIDEAEIVLAKSNLSNLLIVGEPGVGRKSLVKALAQRCYLQNSLPELNSKRMVELDLVALLARIENPERLEIILEQVFEEARTAGNVILVIDELDNFIGQTFQKPGTIDISGILAKYLSLPNFHFIGITSYEGLHRKLEQNPSFLEYFVKVEVSELSEPETIRVLQNATLIFEKKYDILIIYLALREVTNLTGKYLPSTPFPKKAIDILQEAVIYAKSLKEEVLLPHHIAKIISDKTHIPVGKMEFKEKSVLLNLENLIHKRIVNQEEAVKELSVAMRRARSGISSDKRPMGVFLFLGPTGVGKTQTAKALAEIYFKGESKMVRIDMSEFQAIADIPRLIGSISPVEQQGLLTTPVRENPFSLVLLDEIEKAHLNILNLFLQVFDEGHITDGQGRKVIFTNTIIICTSNAGAELIFQLIEKKNKIEKEKLLDFLFQKGVFKPEFVNRFDSTVIFHPLTKDNLLDIAQLMLDDIRMNLKEKDIDFIVTDSLKEKIVDMSYRPEFGAREMRRVLQDGVENEIAKSLLSDEIVKGDKFEINPNNFQIIKLINE